MPDPAEVDALEGMAAVEPPSAAVGATGTAVVVELEPTVDLRGAVACGSVD
ncbi:MAG: hypothetical protein ACREPW_04495 [Candidatus Binataceae bacterium]